MFSSPRRRGRANGSCIAPASGGTTRAWRSCPGWWARVLGTPKPTVGDVGKHFGCAGVPGPGNLGLGAAGVLSGQAGAGEMPMAP